MSSRAPASGPTADSRILQRRREVATAEYRRRRRWALSFLGLIVVAVAAVAVSRSPLFAITGVRVDGVAAAQGQLVRDIAGIRKGQNLVTVDLAAARQRVAALPWVKQVQLQREPPSTVTIVVTARVPLASVRAGGQPWQIDAAGVVIRPDDDARPGRLPRIDAVQAVLPAPGVAVADPAVRNALRVHRALPRRLRRAVSRYDAPSEPGLRVQLRLRGLRAEGRALDALPPRIWVRLGAAERMDVKSAVLLELLAQLQRRDADLQIAEINLTAPGNPVVVPTS
ncbi:MAG: FtsQ-type POTRA domain-containing protein [Euzebyaceae bacterium]|nr:FtsQ-type POTRA domain-containing protein [Euzebyaceae bacterium]